MSVNITLDEDVIIDAICLSEGVNVGYIVGCLTGFLSDAALRVLILEYQQELAMREEDRLEAESCST